MGDRTLHHHAEWHWPYIYHYRTADRGIRITLSTYGGRAGDTLTRYDGGVDTYTGTVCTGLVLTVLGHAWCLRWATLSIQHEETW